MGNSSSVEELTQEEGAAGEHRSINLLLCGLAGTGKSATGNHILGLQDKTFTVDDSDSPTTQKCEAISSKYEERDITVVDTPGLDDTNMDLHKEVKRLIQAGEVSLHQTSTGYNAVLVTVRYGRLTRLHEATIKKFKDINGKSVLQRYGILVVTHGDEFKRQRGKDETIAGYCSQQTGLFNFLWTECNKRFVLFDNVTESEDELEAQRKDLFDTVKSMKNTRYTMEQQMDSQAWREKREKIKKTCMRVTLAVLKKVPENRLKSKLEQYCSESTREVYGHENSFDSD